MLLKHLFFLAALTWYLKSCILFIVMAVDCTASDLDYRKTHLAVAAVENAATKLGVDSADLFARLQKYGIVKDGLFAFYEELHTQSLDWVTDFIIESLRNRETKEV